MTIRDMERPRTHIQELKDIKGIKIGSIIRSLYRSVDDVSLFLRRSGFDVFCIQETFLNNHISDLEIELPGYTMHRFDRTGDSGKSMGGGLVTYSTTKYVTEHQTAYNICSADVEIQCITLRLPHTRHTHILNTYRAPDGDLIKAIEILNSKILQLNQVGAPDIIVLGDMNVDMMKASAKCRHRNR